MKETALRIKSRAIDMFASSRYEKVSVAKICREVGIANSVFYYHFDNKEVLYRELLTDLFSRLDDAFGQLTGKSNNERLFSLLNILIRCNREYEKELAVYREGEFRYPEFDHALKAIYHSALEMVFQRPVSQAEYFYFSGGIRFIMQRLPHDFIETHIDELHQIINTGIFPPDSERGSDSTSATNRGPNQPISSPDPETMTTREKMLEAGLNLFGENGLDNTQVFHIAQASGYSVGMFYKIFREKVGFLEEIIDYIDKEVRIAVDVHPENQNGRNTPAHREAVRLFRYLEYLRKQNHIYSLLREAEFAAPQAMARYYRGFCSPEELAGHIADGLTPELTSVFLRGIAHYLGAELPSRTGESDDIVASMETLLSCGLGGFTPS